MNKNQALAMLTFIADLYQIVQLPDPTRAEAPAAPAGGAVNGRKESAKTNLKDVAETPR